METVGSGGDGGEHWRKTLNVYLHPKHTYTLHAYITHACIHAYIHDTHMHTHTQKRKNEEKNIYTYSINAISFLNIFDLK